jgi:hypothetical protein
MCRWPKYEHILYFSHFQNWIFSIQQCEHIEGLTDFAFQTQVLEFVWISSLLNKTVVLSKFVFFLKVYNKTFGFQKMLLPFDDFCQKIMTTWESVYDPAYKN